MFSIYAFHFFANRLIDQSMIIAALSCSTLRITTCKVNRVLACINDDTVQIISCKRIDVLDTCSVLEVNSSRFSSSVIWTNDYMLSITCADVEVCVIVVLWVQTSLIEPQTLKKPHRSCNISAVCYFFMTPCIDLTYFVCSINISVNIKCGIMPSEIVIASI